jgi:ketosteroid isomerase-like protein
MTIGVESELPRKLRRELTDAAVMDQIPSNIGIAMTPPAGEPVRRAGYTLSILRKSADGRWRLFRDANLVS